MSLYSIVIFTGYLTIYRSNMYFFTRFWDGIKLLLLISCVLQSESVVAQTRWVRQAGGAGQDNARKLAIDGSGSLAASSSSAAGRVLYSTSCSRLLDVLSQVSQEDLGWRAELVEKVATTAGTHPQPARCQPYAGR